MSGRYGVIGNPIAHSRSPEIHRAFAHQFGRTIDFVRLLATAEDFDKVLSDFVKAGGKGLSVTMPFKQRAFQMSSSVSQRASQAAAVNTLIIDSEGMISGDNTDGPGLVTDILSNLGWQINGRNVLLIGAGGAARGILHAICQEAPESLVIANRTESKARSLAAQYKGDTKISTSTILQLLKPFDLIVNATGASLQGSALDIPDIVISSHTHCYDLAYAPNETSFNRWARTRGAIRTSDGLGMLVEQAAVAFNLWQGETPETRPVIDEIRQLMANG